MSRSNPPPAGNRAGTTTGSEKMYAIAWGIVLLMAAAWMLAEAIAAPWPKE